MTPEQLDHLRAIDARLTTLLDLAAMTPNEKKLLAAIYRGIRRGKIKTFVVQFTHKKKRK